VIEAEVEKCKCKFNSIVYLNDSLLDLFIARFMSLELLPSGMVV